MNQLHKDLTNMRRLLAQPHSWAQGNYAYTAMGDKVAPWDAKARCWCLVGAINYLMHEEHNAGERERALVYALSQAVAGDSVTKWNDHPGRTHADVLALLDRAIAQVAP